MLARPLVLALFAVSGCLNWVSYPTIADVPQQYRPSFERIDAYYLGKAKEQAAFSFNCSPEQLTSKVVSTKTGGLRALVDGRSIFIDQASRITTIGVEGCSQRTTYQVLCEPREDYSGMSCDVIPSSDAARVVDRNSHQQQLLDDQAAQQQQQQQQQRQQSK